MIHVHFYLSLVLSHLDFSLNYSVYILGPMKVHHVRADHQFHAGTGIMWIVRPHTQVLACAQHGGKTAPPSLFVPKETPPQGRPRAPEHFFPHLCLGSKPLV